MKTITIPYKPREWAKPLHASDKRWNVVVVHRRGGKTTAAFNHLQRDALRIPGSRWAYIAPYYKQAKNIAWDLVKEYSRTIPGVEYNEVELTVKYPNRSKITLYGADRPDSLRGIGLWGVVFDEYSQQPSNIFSEIIRPALADHEGYAIWIGTPKGKNEFFRLYKMGQEVDTWMSMLLTVEDTDTLSKTEIADAKATMSPEEFEQEFMCSFETAVQGAYYSSQLGQAKKDGRIKPVAYDPEMKVHTVWDLGIADSTAIGFYQKIGSEVRMIDYLEDSGQGLPFYIKELQNKPYIYGKHFAPHDIKVRELSTGKSRWETAKKLGIQFELIPNLPIQDGIEAARMVFPRMWFDDGKCEQFLDYLAQYKKKWDAKRGVYLKNPEHDYTSHAADVHRYMALVEKEMTNEEEVYSWEQEPYQPVSEYEGF